MDMEMAEKLSAGLPDGSDCAYRSNWSDSRVKRDPLDRTPDGSGFSKK